MATSAAVGLVLAVAVSLSLEAWDAGKSPASSSEDYAPLETSAPASNSARAPRALAERRLETRLDPRGTNTEPPSQKALPADSGAGRRVVFSQRAQRTWLVDAGGRVLSTYLVSGSLTDNLEPGRYDVYSRSRWAVGVGDSGVMEYMVRFTRSDNGVAIGFHSIPTRFGVPLQTTAQLGTPQSHGCIRQRIGDAKRLWRFAQLGTRVVVVSGE